MTFVVCIFSSALAYAFVASGPGRALRPVVPALLIVAAALVFGAWRISTAPEEAEISVALGGSRSGERAS